MVTSLVFLSLVPQSRLGIDLYDIRILSNNNVSANVLENFGKVKKKQEQHLS